MVDTLLIPAQYLVSVALNAAILLACGLISGYEYRAITSPRALGIGWAILVLHYSVTLALVAAITGVSLQSVAIGAVAGSISLIGRDIAHRWEIDAERAKIVARLTGGAPQAPSSSDGRR